MDDNYAADYKRRLAELTAACFGPDHGEWNTKYRRAMQLAGLKFVYETPRQEYLDAGVIMAPIPAPVENGWTYPAWIVTDVPKRRTRNIRAVQFTDLEFEGGKLVKVHPFDRPQYMSGDELIALVGRLGEMLHEAKRNECTRGCW